MLRWPIIQLSDERKLSVLMILLVIDIIGLVIGVAFVIVATYVKYTTEATIKFLNKYYDPNVVPLMLTISGLLMILTCGFGLCLGFAGRKAADEEDESDKEDEHIYDEVAKDEESSSSDDFDSDEDLESESSAAEDKKGKGKSKKRLLPKPSTTTVALICFIFASLSLFSTFCTTIGTAVEVKKMEKALQKGIEEAMLFYKDKKDIKAELDNMQIEYSCCGVEAYKDWFKIPWIHEKYRSQRTKKREWKKSRKRQSATTKAPTGKIFDDVPFSCCNPKILGPCVTHDVLNNDRHYKYNFEVNLTLHKDGCRVVLMKFFGDIMLKRVSIFQGCVLMVQVAILILTRIMQTHTKSKALGEDPAIAWLIRYKAFKFPKKGKKRKSSKSKSESKLEESKDKPKEQVKDDHYYSKVPEPPTESENTSGDDKKKKKKRKK